MALVKCPECGKDVSDKAASCPGCGHPIVQQPASATAQTSAPQQQKPTASPPTPLPKKKSGCLAKIGIALLVLVIVGVISESMKSPEEKAAEEQRRAEILAQKEAQLAAQGAERAAQEAEKAEQAPAPTQQEQAPKPKSEKNSDPCANIKTMDDWNNNTSSMFRMTYKECKPDETKASYTVMSPAAIFKAFADNEVAAERKYRGKRVAIRGKIYKIESSLMGYPEIVFNISHGIQTVRCQLEEKYADDVANMKKGQTVTVIGTVRSFVLGSLVSLDDGVLAK